MVIVYCVGPERGGPVRNGRPRVEAMLLVVDHNGPTMMARIGVMRALNRHAVRGVNLAQLAQLEAGFDYFSRFCAT
jgi:hypothetical protein